MKGIALLRRGFAAAAVAAMSLSVGGSAAATPVIDQEQPVIDIASPFVIAIGGGSEQKLAQVVTPGLTGLLTEVRFSAACVTDLKVEVQGVTGGVPNGTVLGSQTVPFAGPFPTTFRSIPFSTPVSVTAGVPYALVLTTPVSCGIWPGPTGNPYPGGDAYFDSRPNPPGVWVPLSVPNRSSDLPFQTLVDAAHHFVLTLVPPSGLNDVGSTHTVTANLTDNGQPVGGARILFSVVGVTSPAPSGSGATDALGNASFSYVGTSVGLDTLIACYDANNDGVCQSDELKQSADKQWVDKTPPRATCVETTNPAGSNVPPAGSSTLPGPKGGQNEDGFYQVLASDNIGVASVVVRDSGSSFVSMPFASGDKVKVTEAPGVAPSDNRPGPGAIVSHLKLNGDAILRVTDASGNVTEVSCRVPPPPN